MDCFVTYDIIISMFTMKVLRRTMTWGSITIFSSNRHDAAAEIVVADERLEILRTDCQRQKRRYTKRQTADPQPKRHHPE